MAASISHNLKNPLGSIKTILQVQLRAGVRLLCGKRRKILVLEEINRAFFPARLNQLLQFSRPGSPSGERRAEL